MDENYGTASKAPLSCRWSVASRPRPPWRHAWWVRAGDPYEQHGSAQQHGWFCAEVVGAHSGEERTCRIALEPLISGDARDLVVRRPQW